MLLVLVLTVLVSTHPAAGLVNEGDDNTEQTESQQLLEALNHLASAVNELSQRVEEQDAVNREMMAAMHDLSERYEAEKEDRRRMIEPAVQDAMWWIKRNEETRMKKLEHALKAECSTADRVKEWIDTAIQPLSGDMSDLEGRMSQKANLSLFTSMETKVDRLDSDMSDLEGRMSQKANLSLFTSMETKVDRLDSCSTISFSGSRHWTNTHGTYIRMETRVCNDRQVYKQVGGRNYIYHDGDEWDVGPTACGSSRYIEVVSSATSPNKATGTWTEWDGDKWINSTSIDVECTNSLHAWMEKVEQKTGCSTIYISGSTHQGQSHGTYRRMTTATCSSRQVYKKVGGRYTRYLYYEVGDWNVGDTLCSTTVNLHVDSTATSPDKATGTWQEVKDDDWILNRSIKVECATCEAAGSNC